MLSTGGAFDGVETLIGRFSNVEVRQTGQGLKLGKYPLHFHLVGQVSKSYITNCSVHHSNNRAIAVHGVTELRIAHNVLMDIRGHAIFIEDGTETRNTIAHNLVAVVRPVWSLLLVDQSPACFWIVNPDNDVYGNVAAGSSHYGIWYRALEKPDGTSGQALSDAGVHMCPSWTALGRFDGNVAHSTGRHGLKLSDYFPTAGGATCEAPTASAPATFADFVAYKTGRFGIWGEFLVDVSFDNVRLADHGIGGIEFLYMNGKGTEFATSHISNSLFVGRTSGAPATSADGLMCEGLQSVNGAEDHDGHGCIHAIHLPGLGAELALANNTFVNYEAAFYPGAWVVGIRGAYTVDVYNVTYRNVSRPITAKIGFSGRVDTSGILIDHDGTLAGVPDGAVAPYTPQFANNPDCTVMYDQMYELKGNPEWVACTKPIRRFSFKFNDDKTSGFVNTLKLYRFPYFSIFDVTDYDPSDPAAAYSSVDGVGNGAADGESRNQAYAPNVWSALGHYSTQRGPQSCVPQAPSVDYLFLGAVGREYLLLARDAYGMPVIFHELTISPFKMQPDEAVVIRLPQKAPMNSASKWADARQLGDEQWGINNMAIGWEEPGPNPPQYSLEQDVTDTSSATTCALNELNVCAADSYGRQLELASPPRASHAIAGARVIARAQGRTFRGGHLTPEGSHNSEGLFISDVPNDAAPNPLLVADFADFGDVNLDYARWRYGYNHETQSWHNTRDPTAPDSPTFGSAAAAAFGNGTRTITPVLFPQFCVDLAHVDYGQSWRREHASGTLVYLIRCDGSAYQDWAWTGSNVSSVERGTVRRALRNSARPELCLGHNDEGHLAAFDCWRTDGAAIWNVEFFEETTVSLSHAAFHYEPSGSKRTGVTWNQTAFSFPLGFDEADVAQLSVLVTGNSSVSVSSSACQKEGCAVEVESCEGKCGARDFRWSCGHECWNVTGDEAIDVPSTLWSGTIWDQWTVTIDGTTPVLNQLTVRGQLIFQTDAFKTVELRAHYIRVRGGSIIMGNESHPILPNTLAILTLHGDRYRKMHADGTSIINEKRISINGHLTTHGSEVMAWSRLARHALAGEREIVVEATKASGVRGHGWRAGDTLVLTSSRPHKDNGGASSYEYHTIVAVNESRTGDGARGLLRVRLASPLTQGHIGENFTLSEAELGYAATTNVVDARAAVGHISRNVIIRGGSDEVWDEWSGLSVQEQHFGAYIDVEQGYLGVKEGYDETMACASLPATNLDSCQEQLPSGFVSFAFTTLATLGRGCKSKDCYAYGTPIRFGYHASEEGGEAALQDQLMMRGCTLESLLTGTAEGIEDDEVFLSDAVADMQIDFVDNVMMGANFQFGPQADRVHLIARNLFLGAGDGALCGGGNTGSCPGTNMVEFGNAAGRLIVHDNVFGGHGYGATISRGCGSNPGGDDDHFDWRRNQAIGNHVGFYIKGGCNTLPLESYRNSIGVAASDVAEVAGFLAVESAIGFIAVDKLRVCPKHCTKKFHLLLDSNVSSVRNATVVARTGAWRAFEWDCSERNDVRWGAKEGGPLIRPLDGLDYVGIMTSGPAGASPITYNSFTAGWSFRVNRVAFVNFTGTDDCGRSNSAFSNQAAGTVESQSPAPMVLAFPTCYPVRTSELSFVGTPHGRARVTMGAGALATDRGHARCYHVDEDGSLVDEAGPVLLRSSTAYPWDSGSSQILADCAAYAAGSDDDPSSSQCPWFVRDNPYLLGAAGTDATRRGFAYATGDGVGECATPDGAGDWDGSNVWRCRDVDFLTLRYFVPDLAVSGSDVLWAPVTWSTVASSNLATSLYSLDETVVTLQQSFEGGAAAEENDARWPQPFTVVLPNQAAARVDFTGDITDPRFFERGDLEFELGEAADLSAPPLYSSEWALIVNLKFLHPVKLEFWHDGHAVAGASRLVRARMPRLTNLIEG